MKNQYVIGIDIGGTRCKIGLVDLSTGIINHSNIFPTERNNSEVFFGRLNEECLKIIKCFEKSIEGIGIGVLTYVFANGNLDSTCGYVPFLDYLPLAQRINDLTGLPCNVCNDAEAIARAEAIYGAGRGYSRVLVLTLGTGVGVGFTVNGKPQNNEAAIHLAGHIKVRNGGEFSGYLDTPPCYCSVRGCFESTCSGGSFSRISKYHFGDFNTPDNKEIFEMANNGNEKALSIVNWFIDTMICALNQYIYIFCPNIIVIGGGLSNSLGPWLNKLSAGIKSKVYTNHEVNIALSELKEEGGVLGAATLLI